MNKTKMQLFFDESIKSSLLNRLSASWLSTSVIGCLFFTFMHDVSAVQDRQSVDLIIESDYVVTMDENSTVIEDGAIVVDEGEIVAINTAKIINNHYVASEHITGKNRVILPGLINGHTHSAMTLFRGIADDLDIIDWLKQYIFPAEIKFVDKDFVRVGTQLACLEMIYGGTTTFVDMYFHPNEIANVVDRCGLRAVIAAAIIEQESGDTKNFEDAMSKAEKFVTRWKNENGRVIPAMAPHTGYTISPENLAKVRKRADELGVPISIHLAESKSELALIKKLYNTTPVNHLENIGFLSGPVIGAHVVWPTNKEISILQKRRVGVIHNPNSNLKIASGISPVPEMLAAGVTVGLGTDGAASNNDLNMWDEIKLSALIHKGRLLEPEIMPAETALHLATSMGARAIGLGPSIGSLEVGKRADLIQVSLDNAHLVPVYDVISHLVYAAGPQDVYTVIVEGKILMRDRNILTLNEDEVIKEARAIGERIKAEMVKK